MLDKYCRECGYLLDLVEDDSEFYCGCEDCHVCYFSKNNLREAISECQRLAALGKWNEQNNFGEGE